MIDLETLGGIACSANGINKLGQIMGYARNAANQFRAFLYNPPILAAIGLLLLE
jgi:probable HAF family extracellular repeat protein